MPRGNHETLSPSSPHLEAKSAALSCAHRVKGNYLPLRVLPNSGSNHEIPDLRGVGPHSILETQFGVLIPSICWTRRPVVYNLPLNPDRTVFIRHHPHITSIMKTTTILAAALFAVVANAAPTVRYSDSNPPRGLSLTLPQPASIDAVNSVNGGNWGKREVASVDETNVILRNEEGALKNWGKREVASVDETNVILRSEEGASKNWGKREVASVDETNVILRSEEGAPKNWGKK